MRQVLLQNARLLDPERKAPAEGALLISGDRVAAVLSREDAAGVDAERVDARGLSVAPGFLDLHHHGGLVLDPDDDPRSTLETDSKTLARYGTTAFLPTTVAWSREDLIRRITALASALDGGDWPGAVPLGIHLEGPWIRPEAAGAQPQNALRPYEPSEGRRVLDAAAGRVRLVTLAPEIPGAPELLRELGRRGVVAALGHTLASDRDLEASVGEGACHVTHLFNAMGRFHHRQPGLAGFALANDLLTCDIICDGVHVHPAVVRLAARAKGEQLLLITDRVAVPVGVADTSFGSGPLRSDGVAIRLPDGRLAASCLTLDRAYSNLRTFAGLSKPEALAACTSGPARLLGVESERGTLRPGARADLVLLDEEGRVSETWVGGVPRYNT